MTELNQGYDPHGHDARDRDEAISAFVYLGEKLRSFYRGEKRKMQSAAGREDGYAKAMFHTIEGEIIPRLMLIHKAGDLPDAPLAPPGRALSEEEREQFLKAILADSAKDASGCIQIMLERGVSRETIFLDLLSGAAKRLGELWEEDRCDFTEVTIGLCRLHQILRAQSLLYDEGTARPDIAAPSVLLTNARDDQHIFGLVIVSKFFEKAGWRVWGAPGAAHDEIVSVLENNFFDVLGLSVSRDPDIEEFADDIRLYRAASCNPDLKVLVGGRFFADAPEIAAELGADIVSTDAETAPDTCKKFLVTSSLHC